MRTAQRIAIIVSHRVAYCLVLCTLVRFSRCELLARAVPLPVRAPTCEISGPRHDQHSRGRAARPGLQVSSFLFRCSRRPPRPDPTAPDFRGIRGAGRIGASEQTTVIVTGTDADVKRSRRATARREEVGPGRRGARRHRRPARRAQRGSGRRICRATCGCSACGHDRSHRRDQVWERLAGLRGFTGRGIGVAVIDSGVAQHAALRGRIVANSTSPIRRAAVDEFGHGTHVAGIIAGTRRRLCRRRARRAHRQPAGARAGRLRGHERRHQRDRLGHREQGEVPAAGHQPVARASGVRILSRRSPVPGGAARGGCRPDRGGARRAISARPTTAGRSSAGSFRRATRRRR